MKRFAGWTALLCLLTTPLLWWLSGRVTPRESIPIGINRAMQYRFFENGATLFAAVGNDQIDVYDVIQGIRIASHEADNPCIEAHATLPDGRVVIVHGDERAGRFEVVELKTWNTISVITTEKALHAEITIAPNGQFVVTCHDFENVRIWDINTGRMIKEFQVKRPSPTWFTISPDSTRLVFASGAGTVYIVSIETGNVEDVPMPPGWSISGALLTEDGRLLSSLWQTSGQFMAFDVTNQKAIRHGMYSPGAFREHGSYWIRRSGPYRGYYNLLMRLGFEALGSKATQLGTSAQVFNTSEGRLIAEVACGAIGIDRDGKTLASIGHEETTIHLWDLPMRPTVPPALLWTVIAAGLASAIIWWRAPGSAAEQRPSLTVDESCRGSGSRGIPT